MLPMRRGCLPRGRTGRMCNMPRLTAKQAAINVGTVIVIDVLAGQVETHTRQAQRKTQTLTDRERE